MNKFQKIIFIEQMKLMRSDRERSELQLGALQLDENDPRMAILEELDRQYVAAAEDKNKSN